MGFQRVGVVGAGQMGSGIAQVVASKNIVVHLVDVHPESLDKAIGTISKSCDRLIKKEKLTSEAKSQLLKNISIGSEMSSLSECDLVIEAAPESLSCKLDVFKKLEEVCPSETIFCSNTSSLSITQIAAGTKRADKVAGMHFMNPVPIMLLVEGIRGLQTSEQTFQRVREFAESLGKTFVEVRDLPGFAVNRILMPMINEAVYVLYEGVSSAKDIDRAMQLGTNQPMGPLALADFIGLDTCLSIMEVLHRGFGDSKYRPCPLLVKYVEAGWLGRKSSKGFYDYKA